MRYDLSFKLEPWIRLDSESPDHGTRGFYAAPLHQRPAAIDGVLPLVEERMTSGSDNVAECVVSPRMTCWASVVALAARSSG